MRCVRDTSEMRRGVTGKDSVGMEEMGPRWVWGEKTREKYPHGPPFRFILGSMLSSSTRRHLASKKSNSVRTSCVDVFSARFWI